MLARCNNSNHAHFKNYGARGIKVLWKSFEDFLKDMGDKPAGTWIERRNNDGNYCKENCRWATPKEQQRNKRTNNIVTVQGKTACFLEMCEHFGKKPMTVYYRLRKGWSLEESFLKPLIPPMGVRKVAHHAI